MTMVVAGCIGAAATITSSLIASGNARKAARRAAAEKKRREKELAALERNRQAIINPYEGIKDVSSMMSNPFASLGVATQAAEFQAEQADISLANTLDTLQQTGSSAGGATALAQAALQSKKEISASIEQQEANNEQLRAQGEQKLQEIKMAEAQRIQSAEAQGKAFMFEAREKREVAQMDRVAVGLANAQTQEMQARADETGALTGMISGLGSIASSMAASGTSRVGTIPTTTRTVSTASTPAISSQLQSAVSGGINMPTSYIPAIASQYAGGTPDQYEMWQQQQSLGIGRKG